MALVKSMISRQGLLAPVITWFLKLYPLGHFKKEFPGFPGGAVVENLPANAGDTGSTLVWEDPTCC